MKKYLLLTVVAVAALASCSKVSGPENGAGDRPIAFQVAGYVQTKADDPADYKVGYQNVPFGAYAWFKGVSAADNSTFMTNQKVSYKELDKAWLPEGSTYYWPKSGTLDFICYSPFAADPKGITIAEDKISFVGVIRNDRNGLFGKVILKSGSDGREKKQFPAIMKERTDTVGVNPGFFHHIKEGVEITKRLFLVGDHTFCVYAKKGKFGCIFYHRGFVV